MAAINGNRRRRSPSDSVSIVYPSPSLNDLKSEPEILLPELPTETEVAYIFPSSSPHIREKKQITTTTEKAEIIEEEEDFDEDEWSVNVSVSKSVSESFSVTKLLGDLVDFVTSTLAPVTTADEAETEATTQQVNKEKPTTEAPAAAAAVETAPLVTKPSKSKLSSLFKPGVRVHPFLASKATTAAPSTTEATTTKRSFFLKKTLPGLAASPFNANLTTESTDGNKTKEELDMKMFKMMSILNNRDAKEEMKHAEEEDSNANDDENEIQDETTTTTEKIDVLLANRNERPKFQVPPSLQAKLLQEAVIETLTTTTEKDIIAPKAIKLFNKPSLLRPFKPSIQSSSITEKPIEVPKRSGFVRPAKPLDLDVSPSSTVTRARTSLTLRSRPTLATTSTVSVSSTTTEASTTEKLTVGEILAGLHGDVQPEPKTSTLRPHSFRPKLDTNRLREKLKKQFENEDSNDNEANEAVEAVEDQEPVKEEVEAVPAPKTRNFVRPQRPSRPSRPSFKVVNNINTIARPQQQTLRTRRPINRQPLQPAVPTNAAIEEPSVIPGERILTGDDLLSSLGLVNAIKDEEIVTEKVENVPSILESLIGTDPKDQGPPAIVDQKPPSLEEILQTAVVVDNYEEPLNLQEQPLPPPPQAVPKVIARPALPSRSRSRARITSPHRFSSSIRPASVTTEASLTTRNNVINNRRLRVRNRIQPVSEPSQTTTGDKDDETTTENVIASTRSSSRFQGRRVIRPSSANVGRDELSTSNPTTSPPSTITRGGPAFGSRTSNLRTSTRINNRVRVRSRARQLSESSSEETQENTQVETTTLGKSTQQPASDENTLIEEEIIEENLIEEEEEKATLRPAIFKPRFGSRQRDAVRNRLRAKLNEGQVTSTEIPETTVSDDPTTDTTFRTVSPASGLSAVPASFFTTTPRFLLAASNEETTTEATLTSDFLPTLTPLQRVGRSTIGYNSINEPPSTSKPLIRLDSLRLNKSRPKFGARFSTTTESSAEKDTSTLGISTTISTAVNVSTTTVDTTTTTTESNEELKEVEVKDDDQEEDTKKRRFFTRPRVDFLKAFEKKIAQINQKEKALLDSFGGGPKSSRVSSTNNGLKGDIEDALKRPRRRFNNQNDNKNEIEEQEETTTTTTEKTEEIVVEKKLPSLPKGLKLPFDTKRFGALQPKLLSFQIIKSKPKSNEKTQESFFGNSKKPSFGSVLRNKLKPSQYNLIPTPVTTPPNETTTLPTTPLQQTSQVEREP